MTITMTTTDGTAIHTRGTGPSLVLLHANGGDATDFDAVLGRLAERCTVHAVDWPGWGSSPTPRPPTALGYADLLPRVLEEIPDGPHVVLGNSVGGFAAIRAAADRPELVRALVLVDPGGFTPHWFGTSMACRVVGSTRLAPTMMRVLPRLYLRRATPAVAAIRTGAVARSQDPDQVAAFASIWRSFAAADHDARHAAARVVAPTMLVWGRRDPVLPWIVDGRRARRAFPRATVATLPCGHQAFAEDPDAFLDAVLPFLDEHAASA